MYSSQAHWTLGDNKPDISWCCLCDDLEYGLKVKVEWQETAGVRTMTILTVPETHGRCQFVVYRWPTWGSAADSWVLGREGDEELSCVPWSGRTHAAHE